MAQKLIKIECEGKINLPIKELNYFQDDLKMLTEENYQKLKSNIEENGYSEPISVWFHDEKWWILNGHQRYTCIMRMISHDGYECPPLPVSIIIAENLKTAKKKVLALTSEYGRVTEDGLYNFIKDAGIDKKYLQEVINLSSNISIDDILERIANDSSVDEILSENDVSKESLSEDEVAEPRNDVMTGLRLLQIFLTDSELRSFKEKADEIQAHYDLKNMTEVIMKCMELAHENIKPQE